MEKEIRPPAGDEHRYNGICQLLTLQELANGNNSCKQCMFSVGTERKNCSHNKEFDVKAMERDVYIQAEYTVDEPKPINVPLNWVEIDQIDLALRLTNKAFKGDMHDDLERKMSDYSMKAKEQTRG